MYQRRWQQQTARSDRWKREDEAPRLREVVPALKDLQLELEESTGAEPIAGTRRTRHIVVARAGALFEQACSDNKCTGGGHDLTEDLLARLEARETTFEGRSDCQGTREEAPCGRTLHFKGTASYHASSGE